MAIPQASLEFRKLTEEAVRGALSDVDADNPIAAELSRLILAYTLLCWPTGRAFRVNAQSFFRCRFLCSAAPPTTKRSL
jgi:hypothetical protein